MPPKGFVHMRAINDKTLREALKNHADLLRAINVWGLGQNSRWIRQRWINLLIALNLTWLTISGWLGW